MSKKINKTSEDNFLKKNLEYIFSNDIIEKIDKGLNTFVLETFNCKYRNYYDNTQEDIKKLHQDRIVKLCENGNLANKIANNPDKMCPILPYLTITQLYYLNTPDSDDSIMFKMTYTNPEVLKFERKLRIFNEIYKKKRYKLYN